LAYEHVNRDVNLWRWTVGSTEPAAVPGWPGWDDHPALAPDGQQIAFASNRTGHNEIWIDFVHGGRPQRLTHHDGPLVISPRWSPNGTKIAFSSEVAGNRDIYVIGADGAASRRLTFEPSQEEQPNWSRDGRWIYFRSDRDGVGQIWKAPPEGGPAVKVTAGEASSVRESADGRTLYFTRGPHTPGIWSVPSNGGREVLLAHDVRDGHWDVAEGGLYYIDWVKHDKTLKRFDLTTRKTTTLRSWTTPKRIITGFSVSRDARTIVWTQEDVAQSDIMLIDPWR
jgi:Tol biopolymer transport system component